MNIADPMPQEFQAARFSFCGVVEESVAKSLLIVATYRVGRWTIIRLQPRVSRQVDEVVLSALSR